jgi:hypothetical protein
VDSVRQFSVATAQARSRKKEIGPRQQSGPAPRSSSDGTCRIATALPDAHGPLAAEEQKDAPWSMDSRGRGAEEAFR